MPAALKGVGRGRTDARMTAEIALSPDDTPSATLSASPTPRAQRSGGRLTARGAALAVFATYLVTIPVRNHADIVAAVFAAAMLVIIAALFGLTVISGRRLKRELELGLSAPESGNLVANREIGCLFKTGPVSIWPLFHVTVRFAFQSDVVKLPLHRLTGSFSEARLLPLPIVFPHRGRWKLEVIDATFGDQLGLAHYRWRTPPETVRSAISVRPLPRILPNLPVFTSSHRSGDLVSDLYERRGDPFDLKPYHPADGMRRIAWKIFARRGELIARHPEASMTPEGQVVLFTLADESEDDVCGAALAYAGQLEDAGLEIFLGTEGMGDAPPARSSEAAERLMNESVWSIRKLGDDGRRHELAEFLRRVRATLGPASSLERLALFCSARRLGHEPTADACEALARWLIGQGIKPVFFIEESRPLPRARPQPKPFERLGDLFIASVETSTETGLQATYDRFLSRAAALGLDCVRIQGSDR